MFHITPLIKLWCDMWIALKSTIVLQPQGIDELIDSYILTRLDN